MTAAYLVGTRGRYSDAARLGVIVAVMHTFSVLVLSLVWVGMSGVASQGTETITAWLQVLAGVIVIGVGVHLVRRQVRVRSKVHATHGHGHGHGHGVPVDPWSRRGLVALAVSGGLLPSPSAFMVLVTGLLTGRAVDAVVLVLAFGTGMAATLTGVGVATIKGVAVLTTRTRRWSLASTVAAWTPAIAGVAVATGGAVYLTVAIATLTT